MRYLFALLLLSQLTFCKSENKLKENKQLKSVTKVISNDSTISQKCISDLEENIFIVRNDTLYFGQTFQTGVFDDETHLRSFKENNLTLTWAVDSKKGLKVQSIYTFCATIFPFKKDSVTILLHKFYTDLDKSDTLFFRKFDREEKMVDTVRIKQKKEIEDFYKQLEKQK